MSSVPRSSFAEWTILRVGNRTRRFRKYDDRDFRLMRYPFRSAVYSAAGRALHSVNAVATAPASAIWEG